MKLPYVCGHCGKELMTLDDAKRHYNECDQLESTRKYLEHDSPDTEATLP